MKITDHKLPEGIALTFRVPEGNIKHPLILLCHGFCGMHLPPQAAGPDQNHFSYNTQKQPPEKPRSCAESKPQSPPS